MRKHLSNHLISGDTSVRDALRKLNELSSDAILFVVNDENQLLGSLTDGDLRRGFLRDLDFNNIITDFIQDNPKFVFEDDYNIDILEELKRNNFKIVRGLNGVREFVDLFNFRIQLLQLQQVAFLRQ